MMRIVVLFALLLLAVPSLTALADDVPAGPPFGQAQLDPDSHVPGGEVAGPTREGFEEILARVRNENAVLFVRKHHNQPWHGVWKAIELDILFHVYGQAGRAVGASVTFYGTRTGQPLRARMEPYVDDSGNVSVYTKLVRVAEDSKLLRTRLKVPYRAFPWPTSDREYEVEARVRLLRRKPDGSVEPLARGATTFSIEVQSDCIECVPARIADCPPPTEGPRRLQHDMEGMFGEQIDWQDEGVDSGNQPAVDPPAVPRWFEAKWRTRIERERRAREREYDKANQVCRGTPCPPEPASEKPCVAPTVRTYRQARGWGWSHRRGKLPPPPSAPAPGSTR